MTVLTRITLMVVGLAVATIPAYAGDDDPNEKAIKARRAVMQLHSWYGGTLFAMAKGKIEYNAEAAATAAANLKMVVNADGSNMWPEGSHNEAYPGKTRALEKGWTDYDPKYHTAMVEAADAMAAAAGNGLDALRANIGAVGDGCSGCHDAYRAEDF